MHVLQRQLLTVLVLCCAGQAFAADVAPGATTAPSLAEGANSFTLEQARTRMTAAGFSGVSKLSKDGRGVWHATASKDGQAVNLALDYRGAVVQLP